MLAVSARGAEPRRRRGHAVRVRAGEVTRWRRRGRVPACHSGQRRGVGCLRCCESGGRRRRGDAAECAVGCCAGRRRGRRHSSEGCGGSDGRGHVACGRRRRGGGEGVVLPRLRGEQSFGRSTVSLALPVLFERVRNRDGLVHQKLAVHRLDRRVGRLERVVRDESEALGRACPDVSRDLGARRGSGRFDTKART